MLVVCNIHRRASLGPQRLRDTRSRPPAMEPLVSRFYFHIYDDIVANDEEGLELPNLAAARLQALKGARELMTEQIRHGCLELSHWIDVTDEGGDKVLTIAFRDAVDIRA